VTGEIPPGQLGQRRVTVEPGRPERYRRPAEPVADADERVVPADHRPADDQAARRRPGQQVDQRLALGAAAGRGHALRELGAGERSVRGERRVDQPDRLVGIAGADAVLREPPRVRGLQRGRGEKLQPPVVLGGDQVQGPPVQPGDQQRAVDGHGPVDVGGGQPGGAGPDGQPGAARVLSLDRQHPAHHVGRGRGARAGEKLGRASPRHDYAVHRAGRDHRVTGHRGIRMAHRTIVSSPADSSRPPGKAEVRSFPAAPSQTGVAS